MPQPLIIDTWPHFLNTAAKKTGSPGVFIKAWHSEYLSRWPSIRKLYVDRLKSEGKDWRKTRAPWIYQTISTKFSEMRRTRENLLKVIPKLHYKYCEILGRPARMTNVILVDLGHGGIPIYYRKGPATFLGLAALADAGLYNLVPLRSHLAHELGHCIHGAWRSRAKIVDTTFGPIDGMICEGFAERMGQIIADRATTKGPLNKAGWMTKCHKLLPVLAKDFLKAIEKKGDMRLFFASAPGYKLHGVSLSGYFLGFSFIKHLEKSGISMQEVAQLQQQDIHAKALDFLRRAGKSVC